MYWWKTDVYFTWLQLRVQAYDSQYPNDRAEATVNITILRNEYAPEFYPSPIYKTVEETLPIGSLVTIVNATDKNPQVNKFIKLTFFVCISYY